MEIELKYSIDDAAKVDAILKDPIWKECEEPDTRAEVPMKAVYYDTVNRDLDDYKMAFRIRHEGGKLVATLKRGGSVEGALHIRDELNAPICSKGFIERPSLTIFKNAPVLEDVPESVLNAELIPVISMDFSRRQFKADYNGCLVEVAVDEGNINAASKFVPICELELELFSGDESKLIELGRKLQEKYGLTESVTSKYARGLELLNG